MRRREERATVARPRRDERRFFADRELLRERELFEARAALPLFRFPLAEVSIEKDAMKAKKMKTMKATRTTRGKPN